MAEQDKSNTPQLSPGALRQKAKDLIEAWYDSKNSTERRWQAVRDVLQELLDNTEEQG